MRGDYKIITVTLNPCADKFITINSLTHGGMNRVAKTRTDAAGKGINVSAALKNLGVESICAGFNYSENGAFIENYLDSAGIKHDFVTADGAVRTNIKLFESDTNIMTEVNEPGGYIPEGKIEELVSKVKKYKGEVLILSGSRPAGVGEDIYARLASVWDGCVFIDTEGAALIHAIKAPHPPFLIKPNLFELETAFNVKLPDNEAVTDFCRAELCGKGIGMVCCSMGGDGAMLVTQDEAWYAPALDIPVRGLAGAGDSMVAGLAMGLIGGAPPKVMLKMAAAAASASVIRDGTQMCAAEGYGKMLERVEVYAGSIGRKPLP